METTLLLLALVFRSIPGNPEEHPALSLERRIQAREAIARVQYAHQIDATRPFDQAVPRPALVRNVTDMLAQSVVLEDLWGVRITAEMLQTEAERIDRATRLPARLAEMRAALGNDETLIQEALVRPVLVSRIFHERFDGDPVIQAVPREEADAIATALADGTLNPAAEHSRRQVQDPQAPGRRQAAFRKVVERPDAFVVLAPFEQGGVSLVAEYSVPKVDWNSWWDANAAAFEPALALERIAGPPQTLTARSRLDETCHGGDTWADTILSQPGPVSGGGTALWTGSVFVVFGAGRGRYDPVLDAWLPLASGAPGTGGPAYVWTGSEVIAWGGGGFAPGSPGVPLVARYNPITDTWTLSGYATSTSRTGHKAVWTGSKMLNFGGLCDWLTPLYFLDCETVGGTTGFTRYYGDGVSYDPLTGVSAPIPNSPGGFGTGASAIWTGSRMIVWGGFSHYRLAAGPNGTGYYTGGTGGIYDPASGSWTAIPYDPAVQERHSHLAVWDGRHMYILGGHCRIYGYDPRIFQFVDINEARPSMARFDPATRAWENLGVPPAYARGDRAVWTGREILVYGGGTSGGRFDPATGLWSPISTVGAPAPRSQPALAWDGESMFVQGGGMSQVSLSDGGRYFPDAVTGPDTDADGFSLCAGDCDDADAAVHPEAAEACNSLDDDCDGVQDNGDPGGGESCGGTDVGECSLGVTACMAGTLACVGEVGPDAEVCNGLDDDCDGVQDDGNPESGAACGTDVGECSQGVTSCAGGSFICIGDVGPRPEACNGLDDDCDTDVPGLEADADQDGYRGCAGDCLDTDPRVRPGATDIPGNLLDENCDGVAVCSPGAGWKNHGKFISCVAHECTRLVAAGLATRQQCHAAMAAARSRLKQRLGTEDKRRDQPEEVRQSGGN